MSKSVTKRRETRAFYDAVFTGKTMEEGKAHIAANVPRNKLSRSVMAAFIAKCGTDADKKWLNEVFMKDAYDTVEGRQIYNQRTGKKIFLEHFNITLISQADTYDEFADLRTAATDSQE